MSAGDQVIDSKTLLFFEKQPAANMLVLADDDGIFGSSMSDSTRAMVTENAEDILVVIYCFENNIDLDVLLSKARNAFERFAAAENIDSWII